MKKLSIIILTVIFSMTLSFSQDTLKIVQYNLLYYGLDDQGCNSENNNITDKTNYLKTIVSYLKPDIFAVNEINYISNYHDYLLANVFLLNGFDNYEHGSVKGQYLTNQIFYNNSKLGLLKEYEIYGYPRYTYVYKFYYKSPDLANGADTIFIWYFVAHLKAGDTDDDMDTREVAAIKIADFINEYNPQYAILSGDLNLYSSTEGAYQQLINIFEDPGPAGTWHNNSTYSNYHTQSTHYYSNGCAAGNGLDDRFDFILFSSSLYNGTTEINYIENSFKVVGQDGQHFGDAVNYGENNSVPSNVLYALANNSDHLPVYAEVFINQTPAPAIVDNQKNIDAIAYNNPVKDILHIKLQTQAITENKNLLINIYNLKGQKVLSKTIQLRPNQINFEINLENLSQGIYLVKIFGTEKNYKEFKILKQ